MKIFVLVSRCWATSSPRIACSVKFLEPITRRSWRRGPQDSRHRTQASENNRAMVRKCGRAVGQPNTWILARSKPAPGPRHGLDLIMTAAASGLPGSAPRALWLLLPGPPGLPGLENVVQILNRPVTAAHS